jgi:FdhD protein
MRAGRTRQVLTQRYDPSGPGGATVRRQPDELIVEEPMSILLDGTLVSTTMRTPGHDFELAAGFCHGDGLLGGAAVRQVKYCGTGSATETEFNVVTVDTGGRAPVPTPRLGNTTSACGLCGSVAIDELCTRLAPFDGTAYPLERLALLPDRARETQVLFGATGAVHAAVAFDPTGRPLVGREDIGRHNAVDKVVGRLLLDGLLPATGLALFVSGRASFEMVQKAWAAGFAAVVAVSAPSALAVDTAIAANLTLAGFARDGRMNVYHETAAERAGTAEPAQNSELGLESRPMGRDSSPRTSGGAAVSGPPTRPPGFPTGSSPGPAAAPHR